MSPKEYLEKLYTLRFDSLPDEAIFFLNNYLLYPSSDDKIGFLLAEIQRLHQMITPYYEHISYKDDINFKEWIKQTVKYFRIIGISSFAHTTKGDLCKLEINYYTEKGYNGVLYLDSIKEDFNEVKSILKELGSQ